MARVTGVAALRKRLAVVAAAGRAAVSEEELGDYLVKRIKDRFKREVGPDNARWAPLSPRTKKPPTAKGILRNTDSLLDAIRVIQGVQAGRLAEATGAGFRIGIESNPRVELSVAGGRIVDPAVYGRRMHYGDPSRNLPSRRFIGLNKLDAEGAAKKVRARLQKALQ